jgi:hypothetical protein
MLTAHVDAYEYLVLLHLACDQIALGTDQGEIRRTAGRLRAVAPEHALLGELDAKARRVDVVQELLTESLRANSGLDKT